MYFRDRSIRRRRTALTDAADPYEIPLPPDGRGTLAVSLPARGLSRELPVGASASGAHVAVSVRGGRLEVHVSRPARSGPCRSG